MTVTKETNIIDFLSRECRTNNHSSCNGKWMGLGYYVICRCLCGHLSKCSRVKSSEVKLTYKDSCFDVPIGSHNGPKRPIGTLAIPENNAASNRRICAK